MTWSTIGELIGGTTYWICGWWWGSQSTNNSATIAWWQWWWGIWRTREQTPWGSWLANSWGWGGWVRMYSGTITWVSWAGGDWVVIISYLTDGSGGLTTASTWGTITTSWSYTLHTFTASGTFTAI